MTHSLRTTAGSHERILVIEVFGRYAGFTALLPTMAGAANRCAIPEYPFQVERLTELLVQDRFTNPSHYSVALISEGAKFDQGEMIFERQEKDQYGHMKLGGIGDQVSALIQEGSAKFNKGRKINVINQRLGYLVRCGNPDAIDSIAPMAFGNLALNLILHETYGRLVSLRNGQYDDVPLDVVTSYKKMVDIHKYYNCDRMRPYYESFESKPLFIMTSDY
jgi:6-phosphofructokinase 1